MRTSILLLAGISALVIVPLAAQAQEAKPSTPTKQVQPYRRFERIAVVAATMPVGEGKKPISSALETAAANALRGRFSLAPYAGVTPETIETALAKRKNEHKKSLTELSTGDIPVALKEIGADTRADRVFYVLVKEATSKQVTLQIWEVETATGKILTDGVQLRRMWDAYPVLSTTPDGGHSGTAKLPPLSVESQSRLVTLMLGEWHPNQSK